MPGWWWTQDHPRSRGEYTTRATAADMLVGSSPLSRGIPQGGYLTAARARIIPALAGNTPRGGHEEPARKDHPRSRGEYRLETVNDLDDRGSSPLSRGIHAMAFSSRTSRRIIPALAGNTCHGVFLSHVPADHPRSRGEYVGGDAGVTGCPGSSPLSRGILVRACEKLRQLRIIPALAGNTQNDRSTREGCQDHPRSRGEYLVSRVSRESSAGSSPLSRGILRIGRDEPNGVRIIPALAGNTTHRG